MFPVQSVRYMGTLKDSTKGGTILTSLTPATCRFSPHELKIINKILIPWWHSAAKKNQSVVSQIYGIKGQSKLGIPGG